MVAPFVLLVCIACYRCRLCRWMWTNGQMDGQMNRWKIQMEKHIYTHAHKSRHAQANTHDQALVCQCAGLLFRSRMKITWQMEKHRTHSLTRKMCELVRVSCVLVCCCNYSIDWYVHECECECACLHMYGVLYYAIAVLYVFFLFHFRSGFACAAAASLLQV